MSLDTGFDYSEVVNSISNVQAAYEELIKAMVDEVQLRFVSDMHDKWACKPAVDFFNNFAEVIEGLRIESTKTFASVIDSMSSAANAWARKFETSWSGKSLNIRTTKIDTSMIKENINGVRGVDSVNIMTTVDTLDTVKISVGTALESAKSAVNNCGFLSYGNVSEQNLIQSLNEIKNKIEEAFNTTTNSAKGQINATLSEYGDLSGKISQAFAGR